LASLAATMAACAGAAPATNSAQAVIHRGFRVRVNVPGMRLLYTSDWSGSREIYTVDPGHPSAMAQVTFGHEPSCDPLVVACGFSNVVPSPDWRHITFTSFADFKTRSVYVSRIDGRARRRVVQLDGGTAARFDAEGLVYAYQAPGVWPGRIRFVPYSQLPLR
jgi:hypothetical protein